MNVGCGLRIQKLFTFLFCAPMGPRLKTENQAQQAKWPSDSYNIIPKERKDWILDSKG